MLPDIIYRCVIGAMGAAANMWSLYRPLVLCFHSVVPESRSDLFSGAMTVTDAFLDRLIVDLRRRDIPILSLDEALARLRTRQFSPFVCLTFDDGYRDVYEHAFPVFKHHDAPFTVFLTTGLVDGDVPMWWHALEKGIAASDRIFWSGGCAITSSSKEKQAAFAGLRDRFRSADLAGVRSLLADLADRNEGIDHAEACAHAMTWTMVRDMNAHDIVTFGCHTMTHPLLSRLGAADLEAEIHGSRERLKDAAGIDAAYFAYPYGQPSEVGPKAPGAVEDAGFSAAFTTEANVMSLETTGSLYLLPRVLISSKAQSAPVVRGYMSGMPGALRKIPRRFQRGGSALRLGR